MTILRPLLGQMNQGAIFSCARADRYQAQQVHGLVITARCDLAQNKFPILNYLPIVSLVDWLAEDGFDLVLARTLADTMGSIKGALKQLKLSDSLLLSHTPTAISKHVEEHDIGKRSDRDRLRASAEKYDLISQCYGSPPDSINSIFSNNDGIVQSIIRDLVNHKISGYYFMKDIYDDGSSPGYVVLLREVTTVARELALAVGRGLEYIPDALSCYPNWQSSLSFSFDSFAMPVGELASPEIEHVLQTFSFLFGRIGLDDPPASYIEKICLTRPFAPGDPQ